MGETAIYIYEYPIDVARAFHITQLEALNCLLAVRTFTSKMKGKLIRVECDNMAAVMVFQNSKGRDRILNAIARALWFHAAHRDLDIRFVHVPGEDIPIVDALSRAYLDDQTMKTARSFIVRRGYRVITVRPKDHDFNSYC